MQAGCWTGIRIHILDAFGWDFKKQKQVLRARRPWKCQVLLQGCYGIHSSASEGWGGTCRGDSITSSLWAMHQWQRWQKWKLLHPLIAVSPKSSGISSSAEASEAVQVFWESSLETEARTPTPRPLNDFGSISFLVINKHGLKYLVWFLLPKLNSGWYNNQRIGLCWKAGRPRDRQRQRTEWMRSI